MSLYVFVLAMSAIFVHESDASSQRGSDHESDASSQRGSDHSSLNPVITTSLGDIRGSILRTSKGANIYSFRGVPYASHERFKPATPTSKYSGTVDATEEGPACPFLTDISSIPMSEDCLRLNVYTPRLQPDARRPSKLPVVIFIHQGGWYTSSGQSNIEGPQYLLDYPIVLVTINYRLGSLGFISTGTVEAPGNLGMKDQVEAMRWVNKHIHNFGGDPEQVTIMGYSAGSISVGLHMLSPMARGLFHRVIAMSGSATGNWDIPSGLLNLAKKQAQLMNCPDTSARDIMDCLKNKDAMQMANTLLGFKEFDFDPILIWSPVVEKDFGQERYLCEHPVDTINRGDIANVSLLTGMTELEFTYRAHYILANETLVDKLNLNWDQIAPILFSYERNTERSEMISRELRRSFLYDRPLRNDDESKRNLGIIYGDALIGFGVHRFLHRIAAKLLQPQYYYKFTYNGRYSYFYLPGTNESIGPMHHDDLLYLFPTTVLFPQFNATDPEYIIVQRVTEMWTNFVITGNPTPNQEVILDNQMWPPFNLKDQQYMEIDQDLKVKKCLFCERFRVWEKLFPITEIP